MSMTEISSLSILCVCIKPITQLFNDYPECKVKNDKFETSLCEVFEGDLRNEGVTVSLQAVPTLTNTLSSHKFTIF